ncbi:MAG: hypothetical protein U0Y82_01725 [Thermoleophilia bacterium]
MGILETQTVAVSIEAPFACVVDDLAAPANHPEWATRFFAGPAVATDVDGEVLVEVPMMGGQVRMRVQADHRAGVVDLYLAPGGADYGPPVPFRVLPNSDGADVLVTLTRAPGTPEAAWSDGLAAMRAELGNLKVRLERGAAG